MKKTERKECAKGNGGERKAGKEQNKGNYASSNDCSSDADNDEWIWKAISLGELNFAKSGATSFDFKGVHRKFGTPLTAFLGSYLTGSGAFYNKQSMEQQQIATNLVEWLMQSGAEAAALTPSTAESIKLSFEPNHVAKKRTELDIKVGGKPTSSIVLSSREKAKALLKEDARWQTAVTHLDHLFSQMEKFNVPTSGVLRAQIPEVVVDMWERIFRQGLAKGDVQIITKDGQPVRAYSHVLEEASPVLKAMLSSSMLEGGRSSDSTSSPRSINVDESAETVRTLLELVHVGAFTSEDNGSETGAEGSETSQSSSTGNLLEVFRLCHRWQFITIGELLEMHLARKITDENIESILEVAVLQGGASLKMACLWKAKDCESLRQKLLTGQLAPAVEVELRKHLGFNEPGLKKRRTSL